MFWAQLDQFYMLLYIMRLIFELGGLLALFLIKSFDQKKKVNTYVQIISSFHAKEDS